MEIEDDNIEDNDDPLLLEVKRSLLSFPKTGSRVLKVLWVMHEMVRWKIILSKPENLEPWIKDGD